MKSKILVLGGTGLFGSLLHQSVEDNYRLDLLGTSTKTRYKLGEPIEPNLLNKIKESDIIIFASWDFRYQKKDYIEFHLSEYKKILKICKELDKNLIFISTYYASYKSKSVYNRAKAACEKISIENNYSSLRVGSLLSNSTEGPMGFYNRLFILSKIFNRRLILTPDRRRFAITTTTELFDFFTSKKIEKTNIHPIHKEKMYSLSELFNIISGVENKFIYINWKIVYFSLKIIEFFGIRFKYNSDGLISIWGEN